MSHILTQQILQLITWWVVIDKGVMVGLYGNILSLITTHHLVNCDICCAKICDIRLTLKTGTSFLSFTSFLLYLYPFFSLHIYLYYFNLLLCFSFYCTLSLYSLRIYLYYFYILPCFSFFMFGGRKVKHIRFFFFSHTSRT